MRALAYLRVSTDEQAESGLGLDAQRHACQAWADREGRALAATFSDDVSGAAPLEKRTGLLDALAALEPGDVLLVAKRDRLGRDPILMATFEALLAKRGARLASVAGEGTDDDSPTNILMRRIVDAFSEYERLLIRSRTRAALDAKRRRGERVGRTPFGSVLVDDGRRSRKGNLPTALAVDPAETALVAEMKHMHAGGMSLRAIARELDARGVRPKSGKAKWAHTSVAVLIRRPA